MQFRNFKMVDYVVYGRGAFNQLDEILAPRRKDNFPMIFFLDHYFIGKPLAARIPLRGKDKIVYVDVTHEPKTKQVDALAAELKAEFGELAQRFPSRRRAYKLAAGCRHVVVAFSPSF